MGRRPMPSTWDELLRTAAMVRAEPTGLPDAPPSRTPRSAARPVCVTTGLVAAAGLAVLHLAGSATIANANSSQDAALFALTNQDRTSNGVHSLTLSGTLQSIGENARYDCDGISVEGRSYDMIRRNYFAHPILGCGQLVFSMMQAFGVHYRSAGENIGWESGSGSPASYINTAFMNSPDHRSNILDANYTELGVGSDESAPGVTWTGVAGGAQNVWMFSEEFAQVGSSSPPPPHSTPRPKPGPRNSPAPRQPATGPITTPASATATPLPTPTPFAVPPGSLPQNVAAPPIDQYEGLLPNAIESVLEAFLTY